MHSELIYGGRSHWHASVWQKINSIDSISTMSVSRAYAIIETIEHIIKKNIPGDMMECGVFKGGNIALFAYEAWEKGLDKTVWAYDTFSGVPYAELESIDTELYSDRLAGTSVTDRYVNDRWCSCDIAQVKSNIDNALSVLCDGSINIETITQRIRYISGSVLDTIPRDLPDTISFVRLDMDIAQPTRHALNHIWPRLSVGGVIHVDDYNCFEGVHQVIDSFFSDKAVYMQEIDYTATAIVRIS